MLLSELVNKNGMFANIQALEQFEFFNHIPASELDSLLIFKYGERESYNKIIIKTGEELAIDIINMFKSSWVKLIEINNIDFSINTGGSKKLTETIENDEKRVNEASLLNKVSAYNDTELMVNDGTSNNASDVLDGFKTRILTEESVSLNNAFRNLSLLEKTNIINTVLKDVVGFTTLSIY